MALLFWQQQVAVKSSLKSEEALRRKYVVYSWRWRKERLGYSWRNMGGQRIVMTLMMMMVMMSCFEKREDFSMFLDCKGKASRRVESIRERCTDKWRDFSGEVHHMHWDWRGDSLNFFFYYVGDKVHRKFAAPELILCPNLPIEDFLFLSSANNSLFLGLAIWVLKKHCSYTMGSGASTHHHFAFQNAEKGMCFPPPKLVLGTPKFMLQRRDLSG